MERNSLWGRGLRRYNERCNILLPSRRDFFSTLDQMLYWLRILRHSLVSRSGTCLYYQDHFESYQDHFLIKLLIGLSTMMRIAACFAFKRHQWSSGRIQRCHRCDPGSIPGWCMDYFPRCTSYCMHLFQAVVRVTKWKCSITWASVV